MQKAIILISALLIALSATAQQDIMSDDEMELFAEQINDLVLANRYEEAVLLYQPNRHRVNVKALSRGDRAWWKETAAELDEKMALFDSNKDAILQAQRFYEAREYRQSLDLLKLLKCDTTNTYREYIDVLVTLKDSIAGKMPVMNRLDQDMPRYIADFKEKRYDGLYELLDTDHIIGYASAGHRTALEEIIDTLNARLQRDPINIVMSGTRLSLRQVRSICRGDISRLLYVMQLDVIHYYNLLFDTDAQIVRYKASDEYASKLAELRTIRDDALHTLYCQEDVVPMGAYDAANGCFHVLIGTNKGMNLTYFNYASADPPKGFGKRFEKVVHEALTIRSVTDPSLVAKYKNGDHFVQHYLTVRLPEIVARQYENHNCRLVICFIPSGIRQYSFQGAELQTANRAYDIFNVRQEFPYSVECRVILYAEDGKVVYDEIVR